jgi:hypothetical protein
MNNLFLVLWCVLIFLFSCNEANNQTEKVPVFSSHLIEYGATFNQTLDTAYLVIAEGKWGKDALKSSIYISVKHSDAWSDPQIAPFSGIYDDSDPHLSSDGKSMFFISNRPPNNSVDIFQVNKLSSSKWSEPKRLIEVNSDYNEYSPTIDTKGNLYFASDRPGGYGQGDLYLALKVDEGFGTPWNLGSSINSPTGEWNLHIANDSILIFESSGRTESRSGYGDLFISFLRNDNWSKPQNIIEINTTGSDLYPFYNSRSGLLFFASSDSLTSTNVNIYSVEFAELINRYYLKSSSN